MVTVSDAKSCLKCKILFSAKNENEKFCKECEINKIDGDKEIFKINNSLFTQFEEIYKSYDEKYKDPKEFNKLEKIKKELIVQMSISILNADPNELIRNFKSIVFIAEHSLMFQNQDVFNELVKTGFILNEISTTLLSSKKLNLRTHIGINSKLTIENQNEDKNN